MDKAHRERRRAVDLPPRQDHLLGTREPDNVEKLEEVLMAVGQAQARGGHRETRAGRAQAQIAQQGEFEARSIIETLDLGWELLRTLPRGELKRIRPEFMEKYYPQETA